MERIGPCTGLTAISTQPNFLNQMFRRRRVGPFVIKMNKGAFDFSMKIMFNLTLQRLSHIMTIPQTRLRVHHNMNFNKQLSPDMIGADSINFKYPLVMIINQQLSLAPDFLTALKFLSLTPPSIAIFFFGYFLRSAFIFFRTLL